MGDVRGWSAQDFEEVLGFEGSCASDSENALIEELEETEPVLSETGRCLHCLAPATLKRGFLCARCDRVAG